MGKNMTSGNPWKLILRFSLPIMAGNLLQQLYNTADSVIVGQFVSTEALGAVGTCTSLTFLFIALALGLSTGAGILVAQLYGAGRMQELRRSVSTAMLLISALGAVMLAAGFASARVLLKYALNVPEEVLGMAVSYLRIYALGLVFQFVYNIAAAVLRSLGDSRSSMYFLLISSLANIVLDLLFVAVFHWGVAGAAAATVIAQGCSAAASIIYMRRRHPELFAKGEKLTFSREDCRTILKLGIPVALQQCVVSLGTLGVQRVVNHFGTNLMSAAAVAFRLENYVMIPIFGLNAGMNVYVGQNMGAGRTDRVRRGFRQTVAVSAIFCAAISLTLFFFGGELVKIFGLTGESLALGRQYMRCESPFFIVFAIYQVAAATLQGSGDVTYATVCTMSSLALRVVLTNLLAYFTPLSYTALWWSMVIGWALGLVMAYIRYFRGTWTKKGLIRQEPEAL